MPRATTCRAMHGGAVKGVSFFLKKIQTVSNLKIVLKSVKNKKITIARPVARCIDSVRARQTRKHL
jgi:hypothetical protein